MKKLKFKLDGVERLNREDMKRIRGGYPDNCLEYCCFEDGGSNPLLGYVWAEDCTLADDDCAYFYGPGAYGCDCLCG